MKRYDEDLHYSFLEFGGNQIAHYNFCDDQRLSSQNKINATKLTNRLILIHHLDDNKDKRHNLLSS